MGCWPQVKLVAAPLVGEGDVALQMARSNVSKDQFYSQAVCAVPPLTLTLRSVAWSRVINTAAPQS